MVHVEIRAAVFNCSHRRGKPVSQMPTRALAATPITFCQVEKDTHSVPALFKVRVDFPDPSGHPRLESRCNSPNYCYYHQKFSAGGICTLHKAPALGTGLGLDFFFFSHFQ